MGTFGDRLRREREMRGVTLEEISHSTKIGTRNLRALENEEFHLLPGGVFNRGFVRAYAHFLGLDEEQFVADYNAALAEKEGPPPLSPDQMAAETVHQENQENPPGNYRFGPLFFLLVAVLVLLVGSWLGFKIYKSLHSDPDPVNAATTQPSADLGSAQSTSQAEPVLGTVPSGPISVALHLKQRCWISVNSDGKPALSDNLAGGTEQQFSAQRTMKIVIGDAAAADISFNGKPITVRGTPGQAVTLAFTPDGYTTIR